MWQQRYKKYTICDKPSNSKLGWKEKNLNDKKHNP